MRASQPLPHGSKCLHGLRESSDKSRLAAEIYGRLDLPDGVPGGVQGWSPFVRGFPVGDHYVIAKTFLDSSASRGGTHAINVRPADELVSDINALSRTLMRCLGH